MAIAIGAGSAATAAWAAGLFGDDQANEPEPARLALDTAQVTRGDLVETTTIDGMLGYGQTAGLTARAQGTVTSLPEVGTTIGRGETLYEIDADPVTLLIGQLPMYRAIEPGDDGPDVRQLEENLDELGYSGFDVDNQYTWYTAKAVKKWQQDRGLATTGRVEPGQVVFATGRLRIAGHTAGLGDQVQPGAEVVAVTSTAQIVTVDLDVGDIDLVAEGKPVTITLPDGSTINGTVASIGAVADSSGDGQAGQQPQGGSPEDATVDMIVTLGEGESTDPFDSAPVEVMLESSRVEDVLTVPVAALLATGAGQYAVEVIEDGARRQVPVEIGAFAGGKVEISRAGITEQTVVGVPAS